MKRSVQPVQMILAALLGLTLALGACSDADAAAQTDAKTLKGRVEAVETRLRQQAAKHAQETQLMIRALEAATQRLDALVRAMQPAGDESKQASGSAGGATVAPALSATDPATTDPATTNPATTNPATTGPGATESASWLEKIDLGRTTVIFLSVSLLLLVAFVVFLPGRLRADVPRIEYDAEPASVETLADQDGAVETQMLVPAPTPGLGLGQGLGETRNDSYRGRAAMLPRRRSFPDPAIVDGKPVPHELAIGIADPKNLDDLVDLLDSYLNTEPYILRNPAPRVALVQGQLHLQFFALPNLSKAEHALLDTTVKRLQPHAAGHAEDAPAA